MGWGGVVLPETTANSLSVIALFLVWNAHSSGSKTEKSLPFHLVRITEVKGGVVVVLAGVLVYKVHNKIPGPQLVIIVELGS